MLRKNDNGSQPRAAESDGMINIPTRRHDDDPKTTNCWWTMRMRRLKAMMQSRPQQARLLIYLFIALVSVLSVSKTLFWNTTILEAFSSSSSLSAAGRIPNVLIAGPQKAGTTSIFAYMEARDDVCISHRLSIFEPIQYRKEVHFFDNAGRYGKGLQFYKDRFRHCNDRYAYVIDGSPKTLEHPDRVYTTYKEHGTLEELKMIVVLREPVSREISEYNMRIRNLKKPFWLGRATPRSDIVKEDGTFYTFEEYEERKITSDARGNTRNHGLYGAILNRVFELFNRKQVLVLSFDEMRSNQTAFLERIHQFLDLPVKGPMTLPATNSDHGYWAKEIVPSCAIQDKLASLYETSNAEAFALLDEYPGAHMEQRPFPRYEYRCKEAS